MRYKSLRWCGLAFGITLTVYGALQAIWYYIELEEAVDVSPRRAPPRRKPNTTTTTTTTPTTTTTTPTTTTTTPTTTTTTPTTTTTTPTTTTTTPTTTTTRRTTKKKTITRRLPTTDTYRRGTEIIYIRRLMPTTHRRRMFITRKMITTDTYRRMGVIPQLPMGPFVLSEYELEEEELEEPGLNYTKSSMLPEELPTGPWVISEEELQAPEPQTSRSTEDFEERRWEEEENEEYYDERKFEDEYEAGEELEPEIVYKKTVCLPQGLRHLVFGIAYMYLGCLLLVAIYERIPWASYFFLWAFTSTAIINIVVALAAGVHEFECGGLVEIICTFVFAALCAGLIWFFAVFTQDAERKFVGEHSRMDLSNVTIR